MTTRQMLSGVLLVDKPSGPTSHDVVAAVRRAAGQRRVGHSGTLDPPASGLLILLLGSATRLQSYVMGGDKVYSFDLVLGSATDTLDLSGTVVATGALPRPGRSQMEDVARTLVGEVALRPPMVSAIHYKGERMYRLARRGEEVERPARPSRIGRLSVLGDALPGPHEGAWSIPLEVCCSGGTYVRSLGEELARRLGVPGCIGRLRRLSSGAFSVTEATTLEEVVTGGRDAVVERLLSAEAAVSGLPAVDVGRLQARAFCHGNSVTGTGAADGEVRALCGTVFLGVGVLQAGRLAPRIVLAEDPTRDD